LGKGKEAKFWSSKLLPSPTTPSKNKAETENSIDDCILFGHK